MNTQLIVLKYSKSKYDIEHGRIFSCFLKKLVSEEFTCVKVNDSLPWQVVLEIEAALQRWSQEKVFWKYVTNL